MTRLPSIKLRPLTMDDFNFVLAWSMDERFCLANGWEQNRDKDKLYKWWLRCVKNEADDFIRMGIEYNDRLIGYADLASIQGHTAELGIAIGESGLWGQGIGVNAARCMMEFGFEKLGITVFTAETHESNVRSGKMLKKLGFKEISRIGYEEYMGTDNRLVQYQFKMV
ncbi:GNAT family N-acetyltransferase [Neobacillus sp. YIM B06451]|uniref:GNAT family N-acetyltransferase n=1 Tax=Neobacillus sp. YIM B06451 TaxID=3070994 RepID=UPI00292FDAD4|nr:GNAT family N-acetyltransferase [Neobacillus sp. YIM B06451]